MITLLEELSANAWGALQTAAYDGWLLRLANGYTRRSNSVLPLYPSTLPLDEKIAYCEAFYAQRGKNPHGVVFKITDGTDAELIAALQAHGYHEDGLTSIYTMRMSAVTPPTFPNGARLEVLPTPDEPWLADYCAFNDIPPAHTETMRGMIGAVALTLGCARLWLKDQVVASGYVVIERGWMGIYGIVVKPDQRGRGVGRLLMTGLLDWGVRHGAHNTYLQVLLDNAPALRLYQSLGFAPAYRYWYLQKRLS